jgi:N-acetylmuramoyl-L-alanine amidase
MPVFLVIQKRSIVIFLFLLVFFGAYAAILWSGSALTVFNHQAEAGESPVVVVIDPGHGGADGGAVAADGTTEAQINLSVSLKLREVLRLAGIDVVMTREEDISVHSPEATTLREQKISDIHNRAALVSDTPNALLISIHQNSLPQVKSVHGAQVFYNTAEGSEPLARALQEDLNTYINTHRAKEIKKIDTSIYLMNHIDAPGILVECGFLSNEAETAQLRQEDYQLKLALLIAGGCLRCQTAEPPAPESLTAQ